MFIKFLLGAVAYSQLVLQCLGQVEPPGFEGSGNPISSRDRVYTGDQVSNTVTVIDPGTNKALGTISFGQERLNNVIGPQYLSGANTHGMGYSRDGKYLVSLSILTNSINVISTATNSLVATTYVDRAPHEAFFEPDNRTIWIGTRGVSTVEIIDGLNATFIDRIPTAAGPSKVLFSGNGTIAYVNHILDNVISVIDVPSKKVMYNITGLASTFSSDMMINADGTSLWAAHKMTGQVSVIDLAARKVNAVLNTGTETNHPNFAVVNGTSYGFVTVASINATRVYRQARAEDTPKLVKTIKMTGIQPHGIWPSPDNTRMYVVNQHSDTLDVIDTNSLEIIDTIPVGQDSQSVIYISRVVPEGSDGKQNLGTQGLGLRVENRLIPISQKKPAHPIKPSPYGNEPQALVTIRETSGLDQIEVIGRDLIVNATYTASAYCHTCTEKDRVPIVSFNATQLTNNHTDCGGNQQVLAFMNFFAGYSLDSLRVEHEGFMNEREQLSYM